MASISPLLPGSRSTNIIAELPPAVIRSPPSAVPDVHLHHLHEESRNPPGRSVTLVP